MNAYVTTDDYINRTILALCFVGSIYSIYLAGRIAERRGRSFKVWAWIAGIFIGPLALPLLLLLPNLHRQDPKGPKGEKGPADVGAVKPVIRGNPNQSHLNMSFAERQNLTMRISTPRFTRLANAFPKSSRTIATLQQALCN
jgi:MFS family permease